MERRWRSGWRLPSYGSVDSMRSITFSTIRLRVGPSSRPSASCTIAKPRLTWPISVPRYLMGAFPIFIAAGRLGVRPWLGPPLFVASILLFGLCLTLFVTGVAEYDVSADGRKLLYRTGGGAGGRGRGGPSAAGVNLFLVDADRNPPTAGQGRLEVSLRMYLEPREEFRQIFGEGWRNQRDYLYVANAHGSNWPKMRQMYGELLPYVNHRADLNYLLDNGVAYENFVDFNGYQPPLNEIDPSTLVRKGVVPENLENSVLTNEDLGTDSLQYGTLTSKGQQLWQDGYSDFLAGGGS